MGLLLVGTVHNDKEGSERLMKVLKFYKPKKITVECSSSVTIDTYESEKTKSIERVLEEVKDWASSYSINKLKNTSYYEAEVCIEYARENNCELHFIDEEKELISSDLVLTLFCAESVRRYIKESKLFVDVEKTFYEHYYENKRDRKKKNFNYEKMIEEIDECSLQKFMNEYYGEELLIKMKKLAEETYGRNSGRDKIMEERILELQPDIHVGGVAHIFNTGILKKPLYKRLEIRGFKFERMRLIEADNL